MRWRSHAGCNDHAELPPHLDPYCYAGKSLLGKDYKGIGLSGASSGSSGSLGRACSFPPSKPRGSIAAVRYTSQPLPDGPQAIDTDAAR